MKFVGSISSRNPGSGSDCLSFRIGQTNSELLTVLQYTHHDFDLN
jgi:hypothetical protein